MIEFHTWWTPNGWKIGIMLEECGLDYELFPVNIGIGDQFKPEFLAISPNHRIPAIIDRDAEGGPLSIFESAAILMYLGRKTGKFYPTDERKRTKVEEWLMWQMGGVGPMFGQAHHFLMYAPTIEPDASKLEYGQNRYRNETRRLYGIMDKQLGNEEFLAGEYSIADMAVWPWVLPHTRQQIELKDFPNVDRWFQQLRARPEVQRGYEICKDEREEANKVDDPKKAQEILFGKEQFKKH